jgi:hypothetical protein
MPKKSIQGSELLTHLDEMRESGMAVTKEWHGIWSSAIEYMWGDQLVKKKNKPKWEQTVSNYLFPLISQMVAKVTKNNPVILGKPFNDDETEWAERWQGIIQYIMEQVLDFRGDSIQANLIAAAYGYAVGKTMWEPKLRYVGQGKYLGEVRHQLINPAYFWVDPSAERMRDAENMGTIRPVRLDWAIRQWPRFESELRMAKINQQAVNDYFALPAFGPTYANQAGESNLWERITDIVNLILGRRNRAETNSGTELQYVWLEEICFGDDAVKHIKIEDVVPAQQLIQQGQAYIAPDGSGMVLKTDTNEPMGKEEWPTVPIQEYDEPVYPKGRIILRAGDTILNPKLEEQVYPYSRWPFNVLPYHLLPFMWQGMNAIEPSKTSQDNLNVAIGNLLHHIKVNANACKIIESNTLAKRRKGGTVQTVTGEAGEVLFVRKGRKDGIKNLEAGRLGPEVFTVIQMLRKDIEDQQFMSDVARGVAGGDKTATESARLDTNAHDMVFLRSHLLDRWIEGTAKIIAEIAQLNYDEGRRVRIIGVDGFQKNGAIDQQLREVEFDLEIEPGSTLPFDEVRQQQNYLQAYQLFKDPIPNPMLEDMLRILKIANRQKVLAKYQPLQLFKQFMQMSVQMSQIGQQQPQPGPNGEMPDPQVVAKQRIIQQQQAVQGVMGLMQQAGQVAGQMGAV